VDLDEGHRTLVAGEDRERGRAEMLAAEWVGVGRDRWDGRRTAAARPAEPVHDVLGVDARPHDDAQLGQPCAYFRELDGQRLLRRVQPGGLVE